MRLWTLHPKYLDPQGLVALWRESLLARAVLRGETRGYRHHPQLLRFQRRADPLASLNSYLRAIHDEALARGYAFDASKIGRARTAGQITETTGQLAYEWEHLMRKLAARSPSRFRELRRTARPQAHPLFVVRAGPIRAWERVA